MATTSKQLRPDAAPFQPAALPGLPMHVAPHQVMPLPEVFAHPPPPPPPPPVFLGGFHGFLGLSQVPGGVEMPGAFLHTPYGPPPPPPPPPPMQMLMPSSTAAAIPHGGGKHPPRSVRTRLAAGPRPRPRRDLPPRMQRAAGPKGAASPRGAKAAKEPGSGASPRSVLATSSPPISPTSSLPASFPMPYGTCATPMATTGIPAERVAVDPPRRRRRQRGPRRARPSAIGEARRSVPKPRRLFDLSSPRTSLMIRNIPNDFTRLRLINILDQHCSLENEKIAPGEVRSEYDFLYVPIDFRTSANKGYAFVNMTSPEAARRLWEHLHDHRWKVTGSGKTCAVDYADMEGLDQLVQHFSGSCFDCRTSEFLPVRFEPPRDGARPAVCTLHIVGRLRS